MDTSNRPKREYAASSCIFVLRCLVQDNRSSITKLVRGLPRRSSMAMPVISWISCSNDVLPPNWSPSCEMNSTSARTVSSYSVRPRPYHLLPWKVASHLVDNDSSIRVCPDVDMSNKYTQHLDAFWYQRNIKLIASVSSALLDLLMQTRPTRTELSDASRRPGLGFAAFASWLRTSDDQAQLRLSSSTRLKPPITSTARRGKCRHHRLSRRALRLHRRPFSHRPNTLPIIPPRLGWNVASRRTHRLESQQCGFRAARAHVG
jgi:hypothetical protein